MATSTTQKVENPEEPLAQPLLSDPDPTASTEDHNLPETVPSTDGDSDAALNDQGDESKAAAGTTAAPKSTESCGAAVSDVQKKIRRAERFGMPVQLSEEDKRNSRAERFGTGSALPGSDVVKKSEDLKRKERATRFGLVASVSTDEEAKKKARLARFGDVSKTDSVEEDKMKARAIRFSQPPSISASNVNAKGNIRQKMAVVGKAGGGAS